MLQDIEIALLVELRARKTDFHAVHDALKRVHGISSQQCADGGAADDEQARPAA